MAQQAVVCTKDIAEGEQVAALNTHALASICACAREFASLCCSMKVG